MTTHPPTSTATRLGLAITVFVTCMFAIIMFPAQRAEAHAVLIAATPGPGTWSQDPPEKIELSFSEAVSLELGGVNLITATGKKIDLGDPVYSSGDKILTYPAPDIADGGFVISWRVISADGHPVSGAYSFAVGEGALIDPSGVSAFGASSRNWVSQIAYSASRFGSYLCMALLIGAMFFLVVIEPKLFRAPVPRRLVAFSGLGLISFTILELLLRGPYQATRGLAAITDSQLIGNVFGSKAGIALIARIGLTVVAFALMSIVFSNHRPIPGWWKASAAATALMISFTPVLSGHAVAGRLSGLAQVSDTLHVAAMSTWFGGVVMLALMAHLAKSGATASLAPAKKFSSVALICMSIIIATGIFQSVRLLEPIDILFSTAFGRTLILKLILLAGVLGFALISRRSSTPAAPQKSASNLAEQTSQTTLPQEVDPAESRMQLATQFKRAVSLEVGLAVAILVATTALTAMAPIAPPPKLEPFSGRMTHEKVNVDLTVDPAAVGRNEIHLTTIDASGLPEDVVDLKATLALPSAGIEPIDVPMTRVAPYHYIGSGFEMTLPGDWELVVQVYVTDVDGVQFKATIPVKSATTSR